MSESNYLKTKNIWAEKRPGGFFLKLNNKKPANYGESLFLENLQFVYVAIFSYKLEGTSLQC